MTAPRRRRSSVKPSYLIAAAASLVAAVSLAHTHAIVWVLLAALAATVAYMLGRIHGQKPARKPATEFAKRKRAAQRGNLTANLARQNHASNARFRRNGWLPPLSEEAGDDEPPF